MTNIEFKRGEAARHFFVTSSLGWRTGVDLETLLRAQRIQDTTGSLIATGCNVWLIPLAEDAEYKIRNYEPMVEGAEFLFFVQYPKQAAAKARKAG